MKDEVKRDRGDSEVKSKDKRTRGPRRDRSRSPIDRRGGGNKDSPKAARRVYVANVSFDTHWSEVKDFFRDKIGNVTYCELFEDEEGRSRGCGLVEFGDIASAKKAIDELHRYNFKGRELVVKEDIDCERDRYGRLIPNKKDKERENQRDSGSGGGDRHNRQIYDPMRQTYSNNYNTYGLSPQFLESLNIRDILNNRIFVANLDYKVGEKKLEEIFRLAGKVLRVRLYKDHNDVSKGHGTVEFEHPVEAVQAISMFHDQNLYGRPMSIRMDKYETEEMPEVLPSKLPSGLESIGKGLGVGGQPLNIGKSLLNAATQQSNPQQSLPSVSNAPLSNPQPNLQPAQTAAQPQVNSYTLSGLGALGQQSVLGLNSNLTTPQVNQNINQALNSGLNSLGLGNLNTSSLTANLSNQNLTQLANTAQNVLAASLGNSSMNSLGLASGQAQNNMFSSYERDYQADRYRNGSLGQQTISAPVQSNNATDKLIVRNLPFNFTWQNLKDRFQEVGDVQYSEIKGRGVGIVIYKSYQDAARAVQLMNGLGYRPTAKVEKVDSTLIHFRPGQNESYYPWVKDLQDFLQPYRDVYDRQPECRGTMRNRDCPFTVDLSQHSCGANFGFDTGSPCMLIKLNRIYDWKPSVYRDLSSIREGVKNRAKGITLEPNVKAADISKGEGQISVQCEGERGSDREKLSTIDYWPRQGFPAEYYPFKNQKGYLSPFVLVKFNNPTRGQIINIECIAMDKNIAINRYDREGSVNFQLLID